MKKKKQQQQQRTTIIKASLLFNQECFEYNIK